MTARRTWRLVLSLLVLAISLAAPQPPASAQALPDGSCDTSTPQLTLITCSDEAAAAGMTVAQFVAKYGGLFVDSGGNLLVIGALLDAWTAGDQLPINDYESCRDFGGTAGACADAFGDPSSGWLSDLVNDQITYAEMGEDAVRLMCAFAPHMSVCALLPENAPPSGGNDFTMFPGGSSWSGPLEESGGVSPAPGGTWSSTVGRTWVVSFDPMGVLPSDNTGIKSTNGLWLGRWESGTQSVTLWHRVQGSAMEFRVCASGSSSACSGWTTGQNISSWDETEGAVVGVRYSAVVQNPCSSRCDQTWQVVTPGGTITFTGNWVPTNGAGSWAVSPTTYGDGAFIQFYDSMSLSTLVEKIGIFNPNDPRPSEEGEEPYVPPEVRPETEPLPEAPPAIPVPIPPPAEVPVPGVEPEVDPYNPVTEGAGDQGLFDQLANRIGGIIDGLIGAMGDFFSWLAQKFADLIGWLTQQLWDMFEWLFENLRALFEWLGELIEWLGGILEDIYDELARITGVIGSQIQRLIDKLGELFEALGRGLDNAFDTLGDIVGKVWEAVLSIPQAFLDGLEELFIPSGALVELHECDTSFPCSWIIELRDAYDEMGATLETTGACQAPSLGWDDFRVSFPPPAGCGVAAGAVVGEGTATVGDLFGYRVALRAAALIAFGLAFIYWVVGLTPWAERKHYEAHPTQQTLFD